MLGACVFNCEVGQAWLKYRCFFFVVVGCAPFGPVRARAPLPSPRALEEFAFVCRPRVLIVGWLGGRLSGLAFGVSLRAWGWGAYLGSWLGVLGATRVCVLGVGRANRTTSGSPCMLPRPSAARLIVKTLTPTRLGRGLCRSLFRLTGIEQE